MNHLKRGLQQWFRKQFNNWLNKRQPPAREVTLSQKIIYILPSRFGLWYILLLILLYLLGTNYQNNLILLMSYMLVSVLLLALTLAWRNLHHITVSCAPVLTAYATETLMVPVSLQTPDPKQQIQCYFTSKQQPSVLADVNMRAMVPLVVEKRGYFPLPRLTIHSYYPFGLFNCKSMLMLDYHFWVFPTPLPSESADALAENSGNKNQVAEDYDTIRSYQAGDSLKLMLWKRLARDPANPVVKHAPSVPLPEPDWITIPAVTGAALELALSKACYTMLQLEQRSKPYGLRIRSKSISPSCGQQHLQRCLRELALC
ncbi:MAG: hypothetical protein CML20_19705 [Rheinheimera sp.]|uniref:hypothetical protein n=1 Tax=Arsukibacterium sp. UBA3155 TaxID=1946058 RepID=UPI000C8F220C|nr:hypothetical protein [Arsukibacterium sp. UBA3155]MAD76976.1 hypothetical protein [Rheinheimera sp.]|tara:strand:+ start:47898 stop:48842 length:945 start_codon:yes stop_codon:yes gene_type:complete